jgi:hypothetical protein
LVSFGHCVVLPFWLPLWYLLAIVLFFHSDYLYGIFWPLCCPSILITSWVSFGHCVFRVLSVLRFWLPLWYLLATVLSDLRFWLPLWYHLAIVLSVFRFWLPLCYLLSIVLSVLRYLFGILKSFFKLIDIYLKTLH